MSVPRGGIAVGHLDQLDPLTASAVRYLRRWRAGDHEGCHRNFDRIGDAQGVCEALHAICELHARFGRNGLDSNVPDGFVGAEESCLAHLVTASLQSDRQRAMMFALMLVRPDVAQIMIPLAREVALAIARLAAHTTPKRCLHQTGV